MSMRLDSDSYNQKIETLFSSKTKSGFEKFRLLDAKYGSPHTAFKSIHIAGTNGKGSVALKIANGLEHAGYKVGLYTSPHIACFRERIVINGQMISEEDVIRLLTDQEEGNFFELTTLLAFRYFAEQQVDFAVIETGLGGRLDATNVITPVLSVITSISLDHSEILGDTLEAIAAEKGGIIKEDIPAIVGPRADFYSKAEVVQGDFINYNDENIAIAKAALQKLGIDAISIEQGIQHVPSCRFEKVGLGILDVAHNPDGFKKLTARLGKPKMNIVLALSKTKDIEECLKIIMPLADSFYLTEASNGKSMPVEELKEALETLDFKGKINTFKDPSLALKEVINQKKPFLVTGTFYIMKEAKDMINLKRV